MITTIGNTKISGLPTDIISQRVAQIQSLKVLRYITIYGSINIRQAVEMNINNLRAVLSNIKKATEIEDYIIVSKDKDNEGRTCWKVNEKYSPALEQEMEEHADRIANL